MTARKRILSIRLLEKLEHNPEYSKHIGIQVSMVKKDSKSKNINYKKGGH